MPNVVDEYKTTFLRQWGLDLSKNFLFILELPINLFWSVSKAGMGYWLHTLGYQIWLTNTEPFFWESQAETLKYSKTFLPILEFPINFFLSVSKSEIESSGPCNICSRLENAKFGWRMQNHFSGKARQNLKLSKNFLFMLELPKYLFSKCLKSRNRNFWAMEY